VEALEAIAVAYLEGRALLKPDYGRRADVYAYAKQDLTKGDRLDGIGGYACYGLIERCEEQAEAPGVPMVLADDLYLKRSVAKDEKILLSDVDYDPGRTDFQIYHRPKEATKEGPVPA
jgi:predicted homoserine dehydrogenase-like protein